ncbi:eukaryotic membrane protein family-domain-containing protein [Choanephora cucurbitarum]|nr:eukaryotic membrane protein family-domain-containing protein [Choanephora cucurbitarum]
MDLQPKKLSIQGDWVETPKLRQRINIPQPAKRAASVPISPVSNNNHFEILSPPPSPSLGNKKKKKRKRTTQVQMGKSPLSNELRPEWDKAQVVPDALEGLWISPITDHRERQQISFLDYLKDELTVADFDSTQELKRERITNFLAVPAAIEKLMGFGFFVCLDSFLYTFTILPLRFCLALYGYVIYCLHSIQVLLGQKEGSIRLRSSQKCDLLKGLLIIITCTVMYSLDPSRIYHSIRGQAVLKLYVVFNVLEICDKLCCSVGVDILDALFSKATLGRPDQTTGIAKRQLKPLTLFIMAAGYMVVHSIVLFFQMITLNVAINFYSNALLSLLISNQFVEIKASVFKRFEKENLFQLTCADVVERFQQCAFLFIITLRNVIELSESGPSSILPSTFVPLFKLPASTSLNTLMTPVLMVIASELMVDWLKHAFITKFNQIRPSIYGKYIDVLCKDLVVGSPGRTSGRHHAFVDQSPVVSRRIGFPVLPLACLHIRMMQQILPMIFMSQSTQTVSTSALASTIVSVTLNYFVSHQEMLNQILPARVYMLLLSMVEGGWLEKVLDQLFRFAIWTVFVVLLGIMLLALKVVVGVNLLGFAYKRYSSMEQREQIEKEREKEMKAMSKDEVEHNASIREYLSKPEDHVLGGKTTKYTLDNVDRFSMVKSRIP